MSYVSPYYPSTLLTICQGAMSRKNKHSHVDNMHRHSLHIAHRQNLMRYTRNPGGVLNSNSLIGLGRLSGLSWIQLILRRPSFEPADIVFDYCNVAWCGQASERLRSRRRPPALVQELCSRNSSSVVPKRKLNPALNARLQRPHDRREYARRGANVVVGRNLGVHLNRASRDPSLKLKSLAPRYEDPYCSSQEARHSGSTMNNSGTQQRARLRVAVLGS